ncbi:Dynactin subunit 2, partial [Podila humilis]
MSSKYSTLPDIDTQPDVYETTDDSGDRSSRIQGMDGKDYESDEEREEIDRSAVSVKDAAARFKDCVVDNSSSDFSDRLNRRKKAMYRTFVNRPNLESSEYEILPKEMILQETPIQKLRRLMYEVKELGQEAELNQQQGSELAGEISHKDLMSHVKSLEHDLSEIGQTLGDGSSHGVLSNEGLIKQTDTGKRLLQQLQAMKHRAATTPPAESDSAPVKVPVNGEIDGKLDSQIFALTPEHEHAMDNNDVGYSSVAWDTYTPGSHDDENGHHSNHKKNSNDNPHSSLFASSDEDDDNDLAAMAASSSAILPAETSAWADEPLDNDDDNDDDDNGNHIHINNDDRNHSPFGGGGGGAAAGGIGSTNTSTSANTGRNNIFGDDDDEDEDVHGHQDGQVHR